MSGNQTIPSDAVKAAEIPRAGLWIAGLLAVLGAFVTIATWRSDDGVWYNLLPLGVYVLLAGWVIETAEGISTGTLSLKRGRVRRSESPIGFWMMIAIYAVLIAVISVFYTVSEFDPAIAGAN